MAEDQYLETYNLFTLKYALIFHFTTTVHVFCSYLSDESYGIPQFNRRPIGPQTPVTFVFEVPQSGIVQVNIPVSKSIQLVHFIVSKAVLCFNQTDFTK